MKNNTKTLLVLGLAAIAALTVVTCACAAIWFAGVSYLSQKSLTQAIAPDAQVSTPTAQISLPTVAPQENEAVVPTVTSTQAVKPGLADIPTFPTEAPAQAAKPSAQENLQNIENAQPPVNDLVELAKRLQANMAIIPTAEPVATPLQVGAQQSFWVLDTDNDRYFQAPATLINVSEHLYFWVEDGINVAERDLKKLAAAFDQKIYPTNRQFFGSEWTPGIDGDPRLHVLIASNLGNSIAGYFSSADEYPTQINEFSNAREMFVINADTTRLSDEYTYGVLAHEFQHMIHWYQDRNEETWLNEGFADLAHFLNGYEPGDSEWAYIQNPDIQLNNWPDEPDPAHYGASFLFVNYFLDRFGEKASQALVAASANGLASIDHVLGGIPLQNGVSGQIISADDVFIDWAVANYLQDRRVGDGRYAYHNYPAAPQVGPSEVLTDCPTEPQLRQVHQYGVDYIRIRCQGEYRLQFEGPAQVDLLPTAPHSGALAFWSNRGDESDMSLTRTFDFTEVAGPLTLNYWTWYDIEDGFDFAYVLGSTDNGQTWSILNTPSGTLEDRSGNSFGRAYTGQSGGTFSKSAWIQESIDISNLAGKQAQIRFEYITDAAVNGEGFLLDDVTIPEIHYAEDFENGDRGWEALGFVRVHNELPQTYRLAVIEKGQSTRVSVYALDGDNRLDIPIQVGDGVKEVILVVAGTTRITRQQADYTFQISR